MINGSYWPHVYREYVCQFFSAAHIAPGQFLQRNADSDFPLYEFVLEKFFAARMASASSSDIVVDDVCSTCVAWSRKLLRSLLFLFGFWYDFSLLSSETLLGKFETRMHLLLTCRPIRCDVNFSQFMSFALSANFAFFNWTNWVLVECLTLRPHAAEIQ